MNLGPSRTASILLTCAACIALIAGPARGQDLEQPSGEGALRTLAKQANKVPARAASIAQRRKLAKAASAAKRAWPKRACAAVGQLERLRQVLEQVTVRRGAQTSRATQKLSALGPASLTASRALLASRRTRRCGGGVKPSALEDTQFSVLGSDADGMRLRVKLPALRFVEEVGGGQTWTRLELPDTDTPTPPGSPGIPMAANVFALPDGATPTVDVTKRSSYTVGSVDVFPAQPEPVDRSVIPPLPDFHAPPYSSPPFEIDRAAYSREGDFPADAADSAVLGQSRDLSLANLRVPAAQYNPRKETLEVLNSVEVTVRFDGGAHTFSEQLGSPWEQAQRRLAASLLNAGTVRVGPTGFVERCGEEMMVITNPSTLAAANTFATARRAAGLRTSVFQTGIGLGQIGTTPGEIQAFIRSRLTAKGCIHPSYVTILGDDELVPTFPGIGGIESDQEYSLRDSADEMSDVAVGRIIGDDATGVATAVNKIINYETVPPGGDWLLKATIAAEFQDDELPNQAEDRTFILFAERSRTGILDTPGAFGLTVDRVYATYPPGAVDPLRYRDGTPLPPELRKPTFAWDGDTADIAAAWNDGRYLMIHRDHGGTHAWDNPRFTSEDADALTNGAMLPVVLSINCSSGAFQDDDRSFATQALVNPNGGAVGVFGDTEVSPTDHNTQLALGFLDALLPRTLAGEGPAEKLRVGDALMWGKRRLAGIWPPSGPGIAGGDGGTRNELYLWHYFGDPSMQMWGGDAHPIEAPDPSRFEAAFLEDFVFPPEPDPPPYAVEVTLPTEFNGEAISLLRDGQVIGKATATDGRAQIPAAFGDDSPTAGELEVAMEADGALPVSVPVKGLPIATTLTTTCPGSPQTANAPMATSGTLEPDVASAQIVLRYTPPVGQPFERTVTTDANGNWSDKITPGPNNPGEWRIETRYEGDAGHTPAGGQQCTVTVTP